MKTLLIIGAVLALVLVAGILVSANFGNDASQDAKESATVNCQESGNCPYASQGGCTADSNCNLPGCNAKTTGSCGCGR